MIGMIKRKEMALPQEGQYGQRLARCAQLSRQTQLDESATDSTDSTWLFGIRPSARLLIRVLPKGANAE